MPTQYAAAQPGFGGASIDNQVYTQGRFITPRTLPAATGGTGPLRYTLVRNNGGGLPDGLSFNANSRVLSGQPLTPQNDMAYTYTVTDADERTATLGFPIFIRENLDPYFLVRSFPRQTYTVGTPVNVTLPRAMGGAGGVTYGLLQLQVRGPQLADFGLSLNPDTGVLTGTPSATGSNTFIYRALAKNIRPGESERRRVYLEDARIVIESDINRLVFIGTLTRSITANRGDGMVNFFGNILFGRDGRVVDAEVTEQSERNTQYGRFRFEQRNATSSIWTYTLNNDNPTVRNLPLGETLTETFRVDFDSVQHPDAASAFVVVTIEGSAVSFRDATIPDQRYTVNHGVREVTLPAAEGGTGPYIYSISPALPNGVNFNAGTRRISSNRVNVTGTTTHTYTVTDANGRSDTIGFDVIVAEALRFPAGATFPDRTFFVGQIINLTLPAAIDGTPPYRYTLRGTSGGLPAGLSFDGSTRILSGRPTTPQGRSGYVYTPSDANPFPPSFPGNPEGFGITIEENAVPGFGDATLPEQRYARGVALSGTDTDGTPRDFVQLPAATGGDGALRYTLLHQQGPNLDALGLSFDGGTGRLTGTPPADFDITRAAGVFTYRVQDDDARTGAGDRDDLELRILIIAPTVTGATEGTVTEDDDANNVASGTLSLVIDGDDATFTPPTDPNGTYGTFSITPAGAWTYTLDNDLAATQALAEGTTDTEVFTVTASAGIRVMQDVTLTVTGANDRPTVTIAAPTANTEVGQGATVDLSGTAEDVDSGDVLGYVWSASPDPGGFEDATLADTSWSAPDTIGANVTLTLTVSDDSGGANADATATVMVTTVGSVNVNGDDNIDTRDAQVLYYVAALPAASDSLNALLDQLRGTDGVTRARLEARAGAWLGQDPADVTPSPDLNDDGRLSQQDARLLYYALRFGDELRASPELRRALGFGSDTAILERALSLP